jgi:hypothetical protein
VGLAYGPGEGRVLLAVECAMQHRAPNQGQGLVAAGERPGSGPSRR